MGEVKIYLRDELKNEFKKRSMERFGYGRGSISKAAEEAIQKWTSEKELINRDYRLVGDPVRLIRGMLKGEKPKTLRARNARL